MILDKKYTEEDVIYEVPSGICGKVMKKKFMRVVTIKYNPGTKKGKAIGQILDGVKRIL